MISNLVLTAQHHERLHTVCAKILEETSAGAVHIVDRNGVGVTHAHRPGFELDVDILSSLVSGNVATANALASLIGEVGFDTQVHQGTTDSLVVVQLGKRLLLIVWFDQVSSLGLVKLTIEQSVVGLGETLDEIEHFSSQQTRRVLRT